MNGSEVSLSENCYQYINALESKNFPVVKQMDSFLGETFQYLCKNNEFPNNIKSNLDYFYDEFLAKIVPHVAKIYSHGATAIFSLYITQFVGYGLAHARPNSVKLLSGLFVQDVLLKKFTNLSPQECAQYNNILQGKSDAYIPHPNECLFGQKLQKGVDFKAITLQNFGRRGYFTLTLQYIMRCQSFADINEIIDFIDISTGSFSEGFRNFLGEWLFNMCAKPSDSRYNSSCSLKFSRLLFSVPQKHEQKMKGYATYIAGILKFIKDGLSDEIINELENIIQIKLLTNETIKIMHDVIPLAIEKYGNSENEKGIFLDLIIKSLKFLNSASKLDYENIFEYISKDQELVNNTLEIFKGHVDFSKYFSTLTIDSKEKVHLGLELIQSSTSSIDHLEDIFISMILYVDSENEEKYISLALQKLNVSHFLTQVISHIENITFKIANVICKIIGKCNSNIPCEEISINFLNELKGKELSTLFDLYPLLPIPDIALFIKQTVGISSAIPSIISRLSNKEVIENYELLTKSYPPSDELIRPIFDAFLDLNGINGTIEANIELQRRDIMWALLILSEESYLLKLVEEEIFQFVQRFLKVRPEDATEDLLNFLDTKDMPAIARLCPRLDLSRLNPEKFVSKLATSPSALAVLAAIPTKTQLQFTRALAEEIVGSEDVHACFLLDASMTAPEDFFKMLIPSCPRITKLINAEYSDISAAGAAKVTAIKALRKMKFQPGQSLLIDAFKFGARSGYTELLAIALEILDSTGMRISEAVLLDAFKDAKPNVAAIAAPIIFKYSRSAELLDLAVSLSDGEALPTAVTMAAKVHGTDPTIGGRRILELSMSGVISAFYFQKALERLPPNSFDETLCEAFFSPSFPPYLRSMETATALVNRFENNAEPLAKVIKESQAMSISFERAGLEPFDKCPSLTAILQCLASFAPLTTRMMKHRNESGLCDYLARLEFTNEPFLPTSAFAQDSFFDEKNDAGSIFTHLIDLLPQQTHPLFEFNVREGTEMKKVRYISVSLDDAYASFLNRFFEPSEGISRRIVDAPDLLCIRLIPSEVIPPQPVQIPSTVDFLEFVEGASDAVYSLHGVVAFGRADRAKYSALVRHKNTYMHCHELFCTTAEGLPPSLIPELLMYRRTITQLSVERAWKSIPTNLQTTVCPTGAAVTKAFNGSEIKWRSFKPSRPLFDLATMLMRRFNIFELFQALSENTEYSDYFLSNSLDIVCDNRLFEEIRTSLITLIGHLSDPMAMLGQLEKISKMPKIGQNALILMMGLRVGPDAAIRTVRSLGELTSTALSLPEYPQFVKQILEGSLTPEKKEFLIDPIVGVPLLRTNDPKIAEILSPADEASVDAVVKHCDSNTVSSVVLTNPKPSIVLSAFERLMQGDSSAVFAALTPSPEFSNPQWITEAAVGHPSAASAAFEFALKQFPKADEKLDAAVAAAVSKVKGDEVAMAILPLVQLCMPLNGKVAEEISNKLTPGSILVSTFYESL